MQRTVAKQAQAFLLLFLIVIIILICVIGTGWYFYNNTMHKGDKHAQAVAALWQVGKEVKNLL